MPKTFRPESMEHMEELKLEQHLDDKSLVLDVGAYQGSFTAALRQKYQCRVIAYEAIKQQAEILQARFQYDPGVIVRPYGISNKNTVQTFGISGDSTGLYATGKARTTVDLKDAAAEVGDLKIDLIKINIEGMEYEVLERLLETGKLPQLKALLIQFHCLREGHEQRHDTIRTNLTETHFCKWRTPWVWEQWELL